MNSNDNRSEPVLELLLEAGALPDIRLGGITWGKGFQWETTCFDVTPVSYAQLGLLPQMHRRERDVYGNIGKLLKAARRSMPPLSNVPNRYLQSRLPTANCCGSTPPQHVTKARRRQITPSHVRSLRNTQYRQSRNLGSICVARNGAPCVFQRWR